MDTNNMNQQSTENIEYVAKKSHSGAWLFTAGLSLGALIVCVIAAIFIHVKYDKTVAPVSVAGNTATTGNVMNEDTIEKLDALQSYIDSYYLNVDEVTEEQLADSLYHGMLEGLGDPYSVYYNEEELNKLLESTEGVYYGIGAYIGQDEATGYCKITKVMDGSPALEAGLEAEDIIVEVNGEDMRGITTSEIVTYIKGEEGTTVDLTIYREGETEYLHITVERRKIESPTVVYAIDDEKIATIQITEFDEITLGQFEEALDQAKEDGMKALVIDLRDNPGGSLQTVVAIANHILPEGIVVYTEDREGGRKDYKSDGKDELQVPLVVLVNGNSASASEILAGSIKDYGKGTILGTQSFGKGIVQKIYPLKDNTAIKLTISHYYTPNGNDIHGIGIEPDEVLEFDTDAYKEDKTDNQMDRAKEILREQIQ